MPVVSNEEYLEKRVESLEKNLSAQRDLITKQAREYDALADYTHRILASNDELRVLLASERAQHKDRLASKDKVNRRLLKRLKFHQEWPFLALTTGAVDSLTGFNHGRKR
jgi:signal transduction histidine kinase